MKDDVLPIATAVRPSVYDRKRRAIASVTLSLNITVHKNFWHRLRMTRLLVQPQMDRPRMDRLRMDRLQMTRLLARLRPPQLPCGWGCTRCAAHWSLLLAHLLLLHRSCACGALRLALLLGHCASTALGCCCLGRRDSLIWCIWPELAKHACSRLGFPAADRRRCSVLVVARGWRGLVLARGHDLQ